MTFLFSMTEAAAKYGVDYFDMVGATSMFTALGSLQASTTATIGSTALYTVAANGGAPYVLKLAVQITGAGGQYNVTTYTVARSDTGENLLTGTGSLSSNTPSFQPLTDASLVLAGDDTVRGNTGNNTLRGYAGSDYIDGGDGVDTVLYPDPRLLYGFTKIGNTFTVQTSAGVDTLVNVERLKFSDQTIAYDTSGTTGEAYRLYQAALNRAPDTSGLGYYVRNLDKGASLHDMATGFINSPEFAAKYGALDNTGFVTQLYANVLHRAPDAGGLAYHTAALAAGLSRADDLIGFSESPENQAALIGVMARGMVYDNV
jgi:Ca2+-binding RTX toxin-like protein